MADISALRKYFQSYISTLKDTSFDKSNGEYLCQSDKEVVNFDDFTQHTKDFRQSKSCDAVILAESLKEIYCIEFRNQKYSDIDSGDIKRKYIDSLTNLSYMFKAENIKVRGYRFYFFVVYKNPTNVGAYKARGMQNEIQFGLESERDKHKKNCIIHKSIIKTEPKDYFKGYYRKILKDNAKCFDVKSEQ